MKRYIYYTVLLALAAWNGTGCSDGYEYFNPNPGDEEQAASPIVNTGKASVNAMAGTATMNGNCNDMGQTVTEAGFLYGRTAAEMMKSEPIVCSVDAEGRFSYTLSNVDNGDHYFRAYMIIGGQTYNGRTGWFEVKVASVPEVTTEFSEAAGGVISLKGSYKLDRDLSVEPGFRYATTEDGVSSVQFVRATQVDELNKTFSLDIPDTGQPCFFQAVVRMSTDFYDGQVSEVIRPKDLSAAGVANCYIVTEGGWYSIDPKRPDGTTVAGTAADWVWSSGSGLVSGVHLSAGRIVFQTSGNAGNAGIALTNSTGEIVWSWHIWMTQAPPPRPSTAARSSTAMSAPRSSTAHWSARWDSTSSGVAKTRSSAPTACRKTMPVLSNMREPDSRPRATPVTRHSSSTTMSSAKASNS